jgi:enoyl-CoA hydratase/carnithine racemase
MESIEQVCVETRDTAVWIILDRADKANALTVGMSRRITEQIVRANADPSVHAIVLTGAGDRVFCAGVDVREKAPDGNEARQRTLRSEASAALQDAILDSAKPVVVVLNGTAVGAGAMIALMADGCVAADDAGISLPEVDIGIPSFLGATILEVIAGRSVAADLIMSGRRMTAVEACSRGLVSAVVPRSELDATAARMAGALGKKPPQAFGDVKQWINKRLKTAIAVARAEHAHHRQLSLSTATSRVSQTKEGGQDG